MVPLPRANYAWSDIVERHHFEPPANVNRRGWSEESTDMRLTHLCDMRLAFEDDPISCGPMAARQAAVWPGRRHGHR